METFIKIYLAGPMRGYPLFNFPAFDKAAKELREQGHEVFNPAERDREEWGDSFVTTVSHGDEAEAAIALGMSPEELRRNCFLADTTWICKYAEGIALLPGWEKSLGAQAELALARALKLEIKYLAA